MYDFKINFHEEDEAKQVISQVIKYCDYLRDDLAYEYIKGFLDGMNRVWDTYQIGYTHYQIKYIGFYLYQWLLDRHLKETK